MISIATKMLVSDLYNNKLSLKLCDMLLYFSNKKDYDFFCEIIENYILDDYSKTENIVEIICDTKFKDIRHITLFQFLINLYFLEFNFVYKIPVTLNWLIDVDKSFLNNLHDYIEDMCQERIYPIIKQRKIDEEECFSFLLSHLTERLEQLSELLSTIASPTINIIDLIEFCSRNHEFNKLLDTRLDDTRTFKELENQLNENGDRLYNIVLADKKSCLFPFIESKCLNKQQLTQMFVAVGPRMSASNVVMSHVMSTSYLNGLQNVGDLIAESEIASKALIYKKKFVGISGYMSREINLSCVNTSIDYDMKDCGTRHFVNFNVKSKEYLELIINKNIILPNGKLHVVNKKDTHLIGTIVQMRSICCCAHPIRGKVCKTCYGNPPNFKKQYKIGGATSTEVENKLSNAVMAVKHKATIKTKELDDVELLKLFSIDEHELILKRIDDIENISILLDKEYIEDIIHRIESGEDVDDDIDDEEEEDNNGVVSKMLSNVKIIRKKYDSETLEEFDEEYNVELDGSFLVLSEKMLNKQNITNIDLPLDSEFAILNLSKIKPGTPVFGIKYITAETSRYLKELKKIIERAKPIWHYNDLDTPINAFADLIIEANLSNEEMVFLEPIIYSLIRRPDNIILRPDFSKDKPEFVMVNMSTSILKGDLTSALVYERITKTLKDIDSFTKPNYIGDGIHDSSFAVSNIKDYSYMKKALKKAKLI